MRMGLRVAALAAVALTTAASTGVSEAAPARKGQIVFQSQRSGTPELYLMNADGSGLRRLTFNTAVDRVPSFSPDGSRVVFMSNRDGDDDLYVLDLATGATTQVTNDPVRDDNPVFSPDGEQILWQRGPFFCPCAVWIANADGSGARQVDTGPGNATTPAPAPHGHTIAFSRDTDGSWSIYTLNLAARGASAKRVTEGPAAFGDFRPRWSPSGNELVFSRDATGVDNDLWSVHRDGSGLVQLTSGPRIDDFASFSPDGERILFTEFDGAFSGGARPWTMQPDGSDLRPLPRRTSFVETFDPATYESSLWWSYLNGAGSSLAFGSGRLEVALAADAANDPVSGFMGPTFGIECRAVGDYDARVRYQLLDWPPSSGVHVLLGDGGMTGSIGRRSESGFEDYLAYFNPVPASALTTHTAGELRLARTGTTLTAYYREGDEWVPLLSGPTATGPATPNLHLFSTDAIFGDVAVRVAYDDFAVSASAFECPSWWRDAAAAWQPLRGH